MIPVEVKLNTSRGTERRFSFRLVEDELFSPLLTYVSLLSVLQGNERAFGTSTIRLDGRVALSGGREIRVQDLFTVGQPSAQAAALVAAPLAFVMTNEFQKVTVERLDLNVTSFKTTPPAAPAPWRGPSSPASTCRRSPPPCSRCWGRPSRGRAWFPSAPRRSGTSSCRPTTPSRARASSRSPSSGEHGRRRLLPRSRRFHVSSADPPPGPRPPRGPPPPPSP